jgi:hypothetical protein
MEGEAPYRLAESERHHEQTVSRSCQNEPTTCGLGKAYYLQARGKQLGMSADVRNGQLL